LKTSPDRSTQCEVLIIGGGIMGSFAAYWIKTMFSNLNVIVIERDNDVRRERERERESGR
jgi:L-2-hydroxyglutarate oxidase LhgO